MLVGGIAHAEYGCFKCESDYDECAFPDGICSQECDPVDPGESGEGTQCSEIELWGGPGGTACVLDGDECENDESNPNDELPPDGNWCPDGEIC